MTARFTAPALLMTASLMVLGACAEPERPAANDKPAVSAPALPDPESVDFAHQASDLPMDEDITYGVLPNGLRYAVMSNDTPSRTATLLMRVDAGSFDEDETTRGLAHFLEHMAFNGSESVPEGEMTKRLERYGLAFGPDTNASTSFDRTIYSLELPEVSDELLGEALFLFRETAERLTLDPDAIDRERGVIQGERRARNSPGARASIAALEFQAAGTDLADRLPIGTEETIDTITPEQFRAFYQSQYRPEDTFIVLVGDRPAEQLATMIADSFSDWQAVGDPAPDATADAFDVTEPRYGAFFDPEVTSRISLMTASPARTKAETRDTAANRAARLPLSFGTSIFNRRLSRLVRSGEAEFTGAGAGTSDFFDAARMSSLTVAAETDKLGPAFQQAERELRRAVEHGFTQAELDEQLANFRKSLEVQVQTSPTRRTSGLARRILSAFANESVMTSAQSSLDRFDAVADTITLDRVNADFAAAWDRLETAPQLFLQSDRTVEEPERYLAELLDESRTVSLDPPEDRDAGTFAYSDFGTPGKVVERGTVDDFELSTVAFDNGVRLTMKTTPYETDVIRIRARTGRGSSDFPQDDPAFSWKLNAVLGGSGLGQHSSDDLETLNAGRAVGVGRGFGLDTMTLSGATVPSDLDRQLELMVATLTDPAYREEIGEAYQGRLRSVWGTIDSTPSGAAGIEIGSLLSSNHWTEEYPSLSNAVDLDYDAMRRWYDDHVRGAPIEIAVVGDFDEETVIDAVARTFGALPERDFAAAKPNPDAIDGYDFPAGRKRPVEITHSGDAETAQLRIYWPVPNHAETQTDRELSVLADVFQLDLTELLREREGATYSPSVFKSTPRDYPDWGYIGVNVEAKPDELERLGALVEQAAAELVSGGITQDEFDRAIKPTLEGLETSLENNGYWLGLASEVQSDPSSLDDYRTRDAAYQNMTADQVLAQARAVFDPDRAIRVHVVPEG